MECVLKHKHLVEHALRYLKKCCIFGSCAAGPGPERPDAIGWMASGQSILIEAKSSRKDLLAEWSRRDRKSFRTQNAGMGVLRTYIAPPGIVTAVEVERWGWGLIEVQSGKLVRIAESEIWKPDLASEVRFLAGLCSKVKRVPEEKQLSIEFFKPELGNNQTTARAVVKRKDG